MSLQAQQIRKTQLACSYTDALQIGAISTLIHQNRFFQTLKTRGYMWVECTFSAV